MPSGVVKKFDPERGFGFIKPDDGGRDVFLHVSALRPLGLGEAQERSRVDYEVEQGDRGPRATNISFP